MQRNMGPAIGEVVQCEREPRNAADRYSVAFTKGGVVVGHFPQRISRLCSLFFRRGGTIDCVMTGVRRYSIFPKVALKFLAPCY